jgi:hypothetical protein
MANNSTNSQSKKPQKPQKNLRVQGGHCPKKTLLQKTAKISQNATTIYDFLYFSGEQ